MTGQRAGNTQASQADLCGTSDWLPAKTARGETRVNVSNSPKWCLSDPSHRPAVTLPPHTYTHTTRCFLLKRNVARFGGYLNVSIVRL